MKKNIPTNNLIDKLLNLHLTKGVQPSDLSDAIFEDAYSSIETQKIGDTIQVTVCFHDEYDKGRILNKMRYTYTPNRFLLLVEQKVGSSPFKTQWSRTNQINSLIKEILGELSKSPEAITKFLNSLPVELKSQVSNKLLLAA